MRDPLVTGLYIRDPKVKWAVLETVHRVRKGVHPETAIKAVAAEYDASRAEIDRYFYTIAYLPLWDWRAKIIGTNITV